MKPNELTPAEIINLWNSYITNSMGIWVTRHFISNTQDESVKALLKQAEEIALFENDTSKSFLEAAGQPLPQAFDQGDVSVNSPALYTDKFMLIIKYTLVQAANVVYSFSLNTCTRQDIRQFYEICLNRSAKLYNGFADLVVSMGLHHPEFRIPRPGHIEKVSTQSFLAGWFADRRPINAQEIAILEFNFRSTEVHKEFLKSFTQITPSKDMRKYFQRGVELFQNHIELYQKLFTDNDLPKLPTWESEILETTNAPFSDRLMLYKCSLLSAAASGRYGIALSSVLRKDLGAIHMRLMTETLLFAEDGANLMIEKGFLDQIPMAKENTAVPSSD
ncbi:MAG TPA: DUF3231 family protein [Bacilli bacterium]